MTRPLAQFTLAAALISGAAIVGCDKTVSEKTTETTSGDGKTTVDKTKTTESPDGSTQTKTEHSTGNK